MLLSRNHIVAGGPSGPVCELRLIAPNCAKLREDFVSAFGDEIATDEVLAPLTSLDPAVFIVGRPKLDGSSAT